MKKESRRVKMTKMLLNESFLKFLAEKPLARITVKEICEEADVNRSTYYAHYADPYDQLKKLETEILIEMSIFVDSILTEGMQNEKKQRQTIKGILEYIQSKKHIFRILLGKDGDLDLQRDILTFFGERIIGTQNSSKTADPERACRFIYTSTGSFGLIYHWIMADSSVSSDMLADWIIALNRPHL